VVRANGPKVTRIVALIPRYIRLTMTNRGDELRLTSETASAASAVLRKIHEFSHAQLCKRYLHICSAIVFTRGDLALLIPRF